MKRMISAEVQRKEFQKPSYQKRQAIRIITSKSLAESSGNESVIKKKKKHEASVINISNYNEITTKQDSTRPKKKKK